MLKLKTALFGYKKTQVCEYISSLSDELTEKYEQEIKTLNEEIKTRDAEISSLKKQMDEQNDVTAVSEIIIEAKNFAKLLKDKATEEHKVSLRKIKEADDRLNALRKTISALLLETDANLNEIEEELSNLQEQTKI